MYRRKKDYRLLLIEDNAADVHLFQELIANVAKPVTVEIMKDGESASDFLFHSAVNDRTSLPDLIIMDLNLPRKDGQTLLRELKAHRDLCRIPIVILSTSNSSGEICEAYALGAGAFVPKPTDIAEFQSVLKALIDFYFGAVALCSHDSRPATP